MLFTDEQMEMIKNTDPQVLVEAVEENLSNTHKAMWDNWLAYQKGELKMNKENKNIEEKIEEQIDITDAVELKIVEETADTLVAEMPDGEVVEIDKDSIVSEVDLVDQKDDKELKDGECVCTFDSHIEKSKVVEIVRAVVSKYNGKVVLAMSEVRDITNAIIAEINK